MHKITCLIICLMLLTSQSYAADHDIGISFDTMVLQGDWNSDSDPGLSVQASYIRNFQSFWGIGVKTGIEYVAGSATINTTTSPYYGDHEYSTLFVPMSVVARIQPEFSIPFHPFIDGEVGGIAWFPDHDGPSWRLPTEKVISSAISPFVGIGGGISVPVHKRFNIELHGSFRYVFDDRLDSIENQVVGGSSSDDTIIRGGLALVYHFGDAGMARTTETTQYLPVVREVSDSDGDGVPDDIDLAPNRAEDIDGFMDSDGRPDEDNDSDGIPDIRDGAPDDREDIDGFEDEDGIPDPDNDGDGIFDIDDPHPNTPESALAPAPSAYYTLHVASYKSLSELQAALDQYKQFDSYVIEREEQVANTGIWHRVYVGQYETPDAASAAARTIIQHTGADNARIFRVSSDGQYTPGTVITLDGYYVHVSSFKSRDNASIELQRFSRAGYNSVIRRTDLAEEGLWYRVIVGPFSSRDQAEAVASRIQAAGLSDYTAIIK